MSSKVKLSKNQKKKLKKKGRRDDDASLAVSAVQKDDGTGRLPIFEDQTTDEDLDVEVEYVSADYGDELMDEFKEIFNKFAKPEDLMKDIAPPAPIPNERTEEPHAADTAEETAEEMKKVSKKKKRLQSRLSVAELKQLVQRPDVVEAHDVTSSDPRLLVFLKAYRNTVPVPRHWCHKRKYLQGKRGMEKIPFQLPEYIADTGIARIRESVLDQENAKKSKQKARDRLTPKMGKIDIDFQVLHDAFFKYQTRPKMTGHGELYYEGKEFEVDLKERKAGVLSEELKAALGMTSDAMPPPWLVNMQRYGPPPSYPTLRIPGLNAPIPAGASFGFQPGGWGKPPLDEYGQPLYGDVFGVAAGDKTMMMPEEVVDKNYRWGVIAAAEEEEEDEEEGDEGEEAGVAEEVYDARGTETPSTAEGIASMASGLETPDTIDLRKRMGIETPDTAQAPRELYHVIREQQASTTGQLFGSDRTYVLPGASAMNGLESVLKDDKEEEEVGSKRKSKTSASSVSSSAASSKKLKDFKF